jgi:hypothetical protein
MPNIQNPSAPAGRWMSGIDGAVAICRARTAYQYYTVLLAVAVPAWLLLISTGRSTTHSERVAQSETVSTELALG